MSYYKTVNELLLLKKYVGLNVNDYGMSEILKIIKIYSKKDLNNRHLNICNFIRYNVCDEISWVNRLDIIIDTLKNDSSSLKSHEIRYGKIFGRKLYDDKIKKTTANLDKYNKKYGSDGMVKWKERYKFNGQSLTNYIFRYGKKMGLSLYDEYLIKKRNTINLNKLNGKKYRNGRTLKEYVNLFGIEIGKKKISY